MILHEYNNQIIYNEITSVVFHYQATQQTLVYNKKYYGLWARQDKMSTERI